MKALEPVLSEYIVSHDVVYKALMETFLRFASDRLSLYGREELFNNLEFTSDTKKLEKVFKLLSDNSLFKEMEHEIHQEDDKTIIKIGSVKDNPDVSMVTTKIKLGDENESSITLLGPTRMDYDKAVSLLDYVAKTLNEHFKTIGGNDNGRRDLFYLCAPRWKESKYKLPA